MEPITDGASVAPISDAEALATPETTTAPALAAPDLNILPSVLGELRKSRAAIGKGSKPIRLAIPGYNGRLIAQFRWVPVGELAATSRSLQAIKNPTEQSIAAAADALNAMNNEILVDVGDKLESLQHEGVPVTFTNGSGLLLALGLPSTDNARDCVMAVFGNEYALVDTATKVMTWLEDTSREVDETHLGE
jgi:hypothetical protein